MEAAANILGRCIISRMKAKPPVVVAKTLIVMNSSGRSEIYWIALDQNSVSRKQAAGKRHEDDVRMFAQKFLDSVSDSLSHFSSPPFFMVGSDLGRGVKREALFWKRK